MSVAVNLLGGIRSGLHALGYRAEALIPNYEFTDLLASQQTSRRLALAAFSDTPPSYRTAAIGVIESNHPQQSILQHRDLGAPHWLCITQGKVESWVLLDDSRVQRTGTHPYSELDTLFERHRLDWTPDSIQRAKLIGRNRSSPQIELLGRSLLTSIEHRVCTRLDGLIREALEQMCEEGKFAENQLHVPVRLAFAMIASKVLIDRRHPAARQWDDGSFESVLAGISSYYNLDHMNLPAARFRKEAAEAAWKTFKASINLRNVSAEDLAFVYEHTLVTDDTRDRYGTHSTPRAVAEYIVDQLRLEDYSLDKIRVYEPYCGAAVLLVAAAKKLRALLPKDWSDAKRHAYLVARLRGADVDIFAKQVSTLSLILADYPNKNGWDIQIKDLFKNGAFEASMPEGSIAICNPPFEDFEKQQRQQYPDAAAMSVHKPLAVLEGALKRNPLALGFVMPSSLIGDATYRSIRQELGKVFDEIELVSLPDRVFQNSEVESALLIARRQSLTQVSPSIRLRSIAVRDADREEFLARGRTPIAREEVRTREEQNSVELWLPELAQVWKYLERLPKLSSQVDFHRGVEWVSGHQASAFSPTRRDGFRKGFHNVDASRSHFVPPRPVYLDWREEYRRGGAFDFPWDEPKVLLNAGRISRGPWRIAAWVDRSRAAASQQFIGAWLKADSKLTLPVVAALLNSPIANAFAFAFNERKGVRITTLQEIPLPPALDVALVEKRLERYLALLEEWHQTAIGDPPKTLANALIGIDAAILRGYDLPPRLERQLLELFSGYERPAMGGRDRYFPVDFKPFLTLEEYRSWQDSSGTNWFVEAFKNIPAADGRELGRWI